MGQARHTEHVNVLVQCLYTLEPQRTRCRPPVFRGAGSRGTGITGESCWPRNRFLKPRQLDLQPGNHQLRYVRQRTPVAMAVVDPQMPRPTLQKPRLLGGFSCGDEMPWKDWLWDRGTMQYINSSWQYTHYQHILLYIFVAPGKEHGPPKVHSLSMTMNWWTPPLCHSQSVGCGSNYHTRRLQVQRRYMAWAWTFSCTNSKHLDSKCNDICRWLLPTWQRLGVWILYMVALTHDAPRRFCHCFGMPSIAQPHPAIVLGADLWSTRKPVGYPWLWSAIASWTQTTTKYINH